jgi:tRNA 2-selenouridine synthase
MAIQALSTTDFILQSVDTPLFDVRSPGEFDHAHIPGAHSLPLFTNDERAVVGTLYKQRSREDAIKSGLDFFGPRMRTMVEQVESIAGKVEPGVSPAVLVHCWRGGMRSGAVAWLLNLYGYSVFVLKGGYKSFRNEMIAQFEQPKKLQVIGGYTGSGKTEILQKLARLEEATIDLEGFAHHKGSAFGHLQMATQPSQEAFENQLGWALWWHQYQQKDRIWVEDESWRIGNLHIPKPFYDQMRMAPCHFIEIPFEERLNHINAHYGQANMSQLIESTLRIQKRLGGLETKTAIQFLVEKNTKEAFRILLQYYDKWYLKGLYAKDEQSRDIRPLQIPRVDDHAGTQALLAAITEEKNTL